MPRWHWNLPVYTVQMANAQMALEPSGIYCSDGKRPDGIGTFRYIPLGWQTPRWHWNLPVYTVRMANTQMALEPSGIYCSDGKRPDGIGTSRYIPFGWQTPRWHWNLPVYTVRMANTQMTLEPPGIYRSDGKRPDGIGTSRYIPFGWQMPRWHVHCTMEERKVACLGCHLRRHFCTVVHLHHKLQPGAVAAQAEERKCSKYSHFSSNHIFTPISIETSGSLGPKTRDFLKELSYRLRQASGEINSSYLLQRLSIAVQRGNTAPVMGSIGHSADMDFFV